MRKDNGTNIASIHHDASFEAHLLLQGHQMFAHKRQGSDGAHTVGDSHLAYFLLDVFTVEKSLQTPILIVGKRDVHPIHQRLQAQGIDFLGLSIHQPFPKGKEGDGTIHGARIDIDIVERLGKALGHRALSATRMAIDGDCNFFHYIFI